MTSRKFTSMNDQRGVDYLVPVYCCAMGDPSLSTAVYDIISLASIVGGIILCWNDRLAESQGL